MEESSDIEFKDVKVECLMLDDLSYYYGEVHTDPGKLVVTLRRELKSGKERESNSNYSETRPGSSSSLRSTKANGRETRCMELAVSRWGQSTTKASSTTTRRTVSFGSE
jgi:hypothetical protein